MRSAILSVLVLLVLSQTALLVAPAADAAPLCGALVGVRCADNGHFCWVYVGGPVRDCVQTSASVTDASVPVGHCVNTDHTNCDGWACVWYGTVLKACVPKSLPAASVGECSEFQSGPCPYEQLVCGYVGAKPECVEDPCYKDPELCHPTLA